MSANPSLIKGCRLWDKISEKMNNGDYRIPVALRSRKLNGDSAYQELDYNQLKCVIIGNSAEVTVGDAEDHKTKIDLARGELDYHDPDNPTNLGVADLMRSIGLRCQVYSRGVRCTGITARNVINAFKATAMVTSMDRRMEFCRGSEYGGKDLPASECRKKEISFFRATAKKEK